jgi:glycosyltransferase involved in cell wall biosynthesis
MPSLRDETMNSRQPRVSVSIIAYNNEPYIVQAIESVLMQQTSFPFEILLGEDQSSDRTREIVIDYAERFPDKIRLFLHDHPPGYIHTGGGWNFAHNLKNARGEYVALLDGDDYWIDQCKLQKQVRFLEENPSFQTCFHNVLMKDELNEGTDRVADQNSSKRIYTLEDIVKGNFIYTCSVLFRRDAEFHLPEWYFKCPIGDWPLHVIHARKGNIGYIPDVMGVYRIHKENAWSSKSVLERRQTCYGMIDTLDRFLNYEYHNAIAKRKVEMLLAMLANALEIGDERLVEGFLESLRECRCLKNEDLWKALNLIGRDAYGPDETSGKRIARRIFAFVLKNIKLDELNEEEGERYFFLLSLLISENEEVLSQTGIAGEATSYANKFGYSSFVRLARSLYESNQYDKAIKIIDCLRIEKMSRADGEKYFLLLSRMFVERTDESSERAIEGYVERFAGKFGSSYKIRLMWDLCGSKQYARCLGYLGKLNIDETDPGDEESCFLLLSRLFVETADRSGERKIVSQVDRFVQRFGNSYRMKLARNGYENKQYGKCIRYLGKWRADEIPHGDRADYYLILYYSNKYKHAKAGDIATYAASAIHSIVKKDYVSNLDAYRVASLYADLKEYKKAIRWFNVVIRYNENRKLLPGSYFHLGVIYREMGNSGKSIRSLRTCLKYDPEFKMADSLARQISRKTMGENND